MSCDWNFGEILALDLLTLSEHTLAAGDEFDATSHAKRLKPSLEKSNVFCVRRAGRLAAYASVWKKSPDVLFVNGFNTHPQHRNGLVLRELMRGVRQLVAKSRVNCVQSHVYKTNFLSIAFHKRLGFDIPGENDKGFEFSVRVERLLDLGGRGGRFQSL